MHSIALFVGLLLLAGLVKCDDPSSADFQLKCEFGSVYDKSTWTRSLNLTTGWSVVTDPERKYCLQSTGTDRITLPNTYLAPSFTISAWVKYSTSSLNNAPYIISTNQVSDYGSSFDYFSVAGNGFYYTPNLPRWYEVRLTQTTSAPSTPGTYQLWNWNYANAPFHALGVWLHMAVTYDASTRVLTIYQNGAVDISDTLSATAASNWAGSSLLYLGCLSFSGHCPGANFIGCLDDVRIYNSSKTATQIQTIYNQAAL